MQSVKSIVLISLICTVLALSSGCAGTNSKYSPQPSVDPASTIQINASFDIPVDSARATMQNGVQISAREIDYWTTYCAVLVQNVQYRDQPQQTVSPGRFKIVKIRQSNDLNNATRIYVASLQWAVFDPPSFVILEVDMRLQSSEQPDVRSLICRKRVDDYRVRFRFPVRDLYPDLTEIRQALGDLIEIEIPL